MRGPRGVAQRAAFPLPLTPRLRRAAQSLYSNKAFYTEAAIDAHMERRHMDKIPQARAMAALPWRRSAGAPNQKAYAVLRPSRAQEADVCLADYCDVLQCGPYAAAVAAAARDAPPPPQVARCSAAAMERAQHRCQARPARAAAATAGTDCAGAAAGAAICYVLLPMQAIVDTCFPLDGANSRAHELNGAPRPRDVACHHGALLP